MKVQPYVSFEGRCEEAIGFYKSAVGAKVEALMRFKDMPGGECDSGKIPAQKLEKVMHACLRIGDSTMMASDGRCTGTADFSGISLTLTISNDKDAEQRFIALGEGGEVTMPLGKTFFSSSFGMLTDRFGVNWMIIVQ